MLTPETYANKGRMQNIVWEPHMADFSDMGVRVQPNSSKLQKGGDQPIMALFKAQTELQDIQNNRRCVYNFFTSHRKKIHDEYVKAKKAGTSGKNSPLIKPKRTQQLGIS